MSSVDVDEEVNEVEDDEAANDLANADVVTKYQTAGKIANECLAKVIAACVPGTKAVTLCLVGDEVRACRVVPGARRQRRHASRSAPPRLAGHRGVHRQDLQRQGQGRQEDRQRPPSHGQSAPPPSGHWPTSAPAPRRGAPGGSSLADTPRGRGRPLGHRATASGARARRLQSRRRHTPARHKPARPLTPQASPSRLASRPTTAWATTRRW